MRHPELRCENCQAFETIKNGDKESHYCHAEPIKGHAIQAPVQFDLSLSQQRDVPPRWQIVPSFPPTLPSLYCMKIMLKPDIHKKLMEEMLIQARDSGSEEDVQKVLKLNELGGADVFG